MDTKDVSVNVEAATNKSKLGSGDAMDGNFNGVYINRGFDGTEAIEMSDTKTIELNNNASNKFGNGERRLIERTKSFRQTKTSLVWDSLSYEVVKRKWVWSGCGWRREVTHKQILKPQNGEIVAGTLTALMGPSGAGKSTLLNTLTGRYVTGVRGNVYVSCPGSKPKANIAFVPQRDDLFKVFTVKESLLFASKMKNLKMNDHNEQVERVMKWLNLTSCEAVKVARCSGGQVKRVCIGVELISNPDILVLDEPTTGLDSSTAAQCVGLLKRLTESDDNPPAIVATIHQPNYKIFNEFHKVYLLSRNGQNIYFGSPHDVVDFFAGFNLVCPSYCNPADYAIEVAYGDYGQECFKKMEEHNRRINFTDIDYGAKFDLKKIVDKMRSKKLPFFKHTGFLLRRNWGNMFRDSNQFWFRNLQGIVIAFMISYLWVYPVGENDACWSNFENPVNTSDLKHNLFKINITAAKDEYLTKITRIADNSAFIFSAILYVMMTCLMTSVLSFPLETHIVVREIGNNWYKVFPYFLAKTACDLPALVLSNLLLMSITYPMTGQIPELWRFMIVYMVGNLVGEICQTWGWFIGTLLANDVISAALVTMAMTLPQIMFAGFLVRLSGMPWFYRPLSYLSYLRYAFESLVIAIYGFDRCKVTNAPNFIDEFVNAQDPYKIAKNMIETLNISTKDTERFSYLLGVEPMCLEDTFNKTKEYLGVGVYEDYDYSFNETSIVDEMTNTQNPSYILSYYELEDYIMYIDIACLVLMMIIMKIMVLVALRIKTKVTQ